MSNILHPSQEKLHPSNQTLYFLMALHSQYEIKFNKFL